MSGHSKWANIKHRKGKQDAKRGKVFTRLAKEITISARDGGDADSNSRLRLAVANARAVNMPSDNIQRAIKKGTGELEGGNYFEVTYEGYAPGGVAVIVETVTDNKNRTLPEVRSTMSKYGGSMAENNAVAWNFERKGVITINTAGKTEDELFEELMESGADDLDYDEESTRIICAMENFAIVNKYFESKQFEITEAKLEYLPKQILNITDLTEAQRVMKFIDTLEDLDDVQNVFSNFEIDDSIADQLED